MYVIGHFLYFMFPLFLPYSEICRNLEDASSVEEQVDPHTLGARTFTFFFGAR